MSTKQISINLSSLSSHSHKTRKNARSKEKPIISPNVLKNKLLNRIKEHKKRESNSLTTSSNNNDSKDILAYSDEFNESMDYLENLSKQTQKEKKREELYRQTLKNHSVSTPVLNVYNDLPEELIDINKAFVSSVYPKLSSDTVPYGILKNGSKPTFREWQKTQKNISSFSPSLSNDREKRVADLKAKFASLTTSPSSITTSPLTTASPLTTTSPSTTSPSSIITSPSHIPVSPINTMSYTNTPLTSSVQSCSPSDEKTSSYTSKKYTLGKKHNIVGVLLKDNKTRKNVMTAHQNLKKKTISQIKEYLKDHNLIKVGSTAPTDVLKEMYVSAMLTGDVTNSNQDILLHNFLKSEENK
jgi:hypothetical protein